MTEVAKCSSCGRAVIWAVSPSGARLPLDARAATMYYLDNATPPNAVPVKAKVVQLPAGLFDLGEEVEPKTYVSHFLTCPNASEHSRVRR